MDLDAFSELVSQFLKVFPAEATPQPIFDEEYDEFFEALETHAPADDIGKEWADALWVWILMGHYFGVDFQKALTSVAHKNWLKMKHKHLFHQDPVTKKWIKPEGWNEKVESGEIS